MNDGTIVTYDVNVMIDDLISFTHTGTNVIYSGRGNVVTMAVEWITDVLYWVEFDGTNSQVCIMNISSLTYIHSTTITFTF